MAAFHDLDRLIATMRDLEGRINYVRLSLYKNQEELSILLLLQETLEENITELKKPGQIVMATEFRKAIDDLKKTHTRMSFLKMNQLTLETAYVGQTGMFNHLLRLHAEEVMGLKNNVLQFDLGRRKNGR